VLSIFISLTSAYLAKKAQTSQIMGAIRDMVMPSPLGPVTPTIFRVETSLPWTNIRIDPDLKWLQNYPYRAEASWWIFAAAGRAAIFITLLTVSFQAIEAAFANPVKSLRSE
jgi:hypothetical protein